MHIRGLGTENIDEVDRSEITTSERYSRGDSDAGNSTGDFDSDNDTHLGRHGQRHEEERMCLPDGRHTDPAGDFGEPRESTFNPVHPEFQHSVEISPDARESDHHRSSSTANTHELRGPGASPHTTRRHVQAQFAPVS